MNINKIYEKLLKLKLELAMRCGDGTGKIVSHSINCDCERIYKEMSILEAELALQKEIKND